MKIPTFFAAIFVAITTLSFSCQDDRCVQEGKSHFMCKHPHTILEGQWKAVEFTIDGADSLALIKDKGIAKCFRMSREYSGTKSLLMAFLSCCCTYYGHGFPPYYSEASLKHFDIRCTDPHLFSNAHIGFSASVISKNEIRLTQNDKIKRFIYIRLVRC